MTTRKMIRTVVLVASLAVGLYHAAQVFEVIESAKRGGGMHAMAANGQIPEALRPAMTAALQSKGNDATINDLLAGMARKTSEKSDDLVIFSPDGERLSPEERERLKRQAESMRPKPKSAK